MVNHFPTDPLGKVPTLRDAWSLLADGMQFHRFFLEVKPALVRRAVSDLVFATPGVSDAEVLHVVRRARPGVARFVSEHTDEAFRFLADSSPPTIQVGSSRLPVYSMRSGRLTSEPMRDSAVLNTIEFCSGLFAAAMTIGFVECAAHCLVVTDSPIDVQPELPVVCLMDDIEPLVAFTSLIDRAAHVFAFGFWDVGWSADDKQRHVNLRREIAELAAVSLRFRTLWRLKHDDTLWKSAEERFGSRQVNELFASSESQASHLSDEVIEELLGKIDGNLILSDFVRTLPPWSGQFQQYEAGIGTGQAVG